MSLRGRVQGDLFFFVSCICGPQNKFMLLSSPKPMDGKVGQLEQNPVSLSSCNMVLLHRAEVVCVETLGLTQVQGLDIHLEKGSLGLGLHSFLSPRILSTSKRSALTYPKASVACPCGLGVLRH